MTSHAIAVLVTVCAIYSIARAAWRFRLAVRSASWPFVIGCVLRSAYAHDNYPAQMDSYRVGILYEYTVGEVRYTCEQIAIGRSRFLPHHSARTMVYRYPPGTEVKVYYDPADPSRAVLQAGQFGYALFNLAAVLIVVAIAISAFWKAS